MSSIASRPALTLPPEIFENNTVSSRESPISDSVFFSSEVGFSNASSEEDNRVAHSDPTFNRSRRSFFTADFSSNETKVPADLSRISSIASTTIDKFPS